MHRLNAPQILFSMESIDCMRYLEMVFYARLLRKKSLRMTTKVWASDWRDNYSQQQQTRH